MPKKRQKEPPVVPVEGEEAPPTKQRKRRKFKSKFRTPLPTDQPEEEGQGPVTPPQPDPPRLLNLDRAINEVEGATETEKQILDNIFQKAFSRYTKRGEANRGVEMIGEVVSHIQSGAPIKGLESKLMPLLNEQASKTTILQAAMFNHMMELVAIHWDMRWHLWRDLWADLKTQKLSAVEKLALLKMADTCAVRAAAYINDQSNNFHPMTEVDATVERASKHSVDKAKIERQKEMEGTTPQGREIIRRLTFKANQAAEKLITAELSKIKEPPKTS